MRPITLSVMGMCVLATALPAQAVSATDCARAAAYVVGQPLPGVNDTPLAWTALSGCDSLGEAAAVQALQSTAVISETDESKIQEFMALFSQRRTSAFFAAWKALILNPQSSDNFKRAAIDAFGNLYRPGMGFTHASTTAVNVASCGVDYIGGPGPSGALTDLPADALSQMVATFASAAANASNSIATRGRANCWMLFLAHFQPKAASGIHAVYVCGNKFQITNTNAVQVVVNADVIPPTALQKIEHHTNTIPPTSGSWTIPGQMKGNLRVSFNGTVIQTVINGGTACP